MGKQGEVHSKIDQKTLLKYINYLTHFPTSSNKIKKEYPAAHTTLTFINKKRKRETNPEVLASEAYYFLRQRKFAIPYEREALYSQAPYYGYGMGNLDFAASMSIYLKKKRINHDFIVTTPRNLSDVKDLALLQDVFYFIRVNTDKPFFIGQPAKFASYNTIEQEFEGTDAYAINMMEKRKRRTLKKITIPASTQEANSDNIKLKVLFDIEDTDQVRVSRSVLSTGHSLLSHSDAIVPYEYLYDGREEKYNFQLLENTKTSKKEKAELVKKISQMKEQHTKDRMDKMKKSLEGEFDAKIVSYDSITLKETGIWPEQTGLSYQDEYKMEGIVESAGNGYLLNIGKLIGKQIDLTKEQLSRKDDIYMPYARSFSYEIEIPIPAGYEVKGLDKIRYNITNPTGGFVSQAKMEGTTLKVSTRKYYTHNYEKVEQWPEITAFVEAAYTFTQQKVLLQKTAK